MSDYKAAAKQSTAQKANRITGGKYRPGHSAKGYANGGDTTSSTSSTGSSSSSKSKSSYGSMFIPVPNQASGGAVRKSKRSKGSGKTQINIIVGGNGAGAGPGAAPTPNPAAAAAILPALAAAGRSNALPPVPTNNAQPPLGGTAGMVRKRGGRA